MWLDEGHYHIYFFRSNMVFIMIYLALQVRKQEFNIQLNYISLVIIIRLYNSSYQKLVEAEVVTTSKEEITPINALFPIFSI